MPTSKSSFKRILCITPVFLYFCVYNIFKLDINTKRFLDHYGTDGRDDFVDGNCFIIEPAYSGLKQWGNSVYYYMSAMMYLLRKGATYVVIPTVAGKNPIGVVNLDGVAYGPNATVNFDDSSCEKIHPQELWTGMYGNMWDFMKLREDWDNLSKDWPKGATLNLNPFESDFGIYPSLENVTNSLNVNWEGVLVIHIRQGDVMAQVNERVFFGHSQPPCAYYEDVIETGYDGNSFPHLLIITNKIPGGNPTFVNPCDQYLEDKYSSGEYTTKLLDYNLIANRLFTKESHAGKAGENEGLRKDLFILSEAMNVAEGHSTFTMGTVMFDYKLKRHFYPAAPATINTLTQTKRTIDGLSVFTRQFYLSNVEQTLYSLEGWLGFDGSCNGYEKNIHSPFAGFIHSATEQAKSWKDTNFTEKLLSYDRSLMVKFKTMNEPFQCQGLSVMTGNPSWYVPCVCKTPTTTGLESSPRGLR